MGIPDDIDIILGYGALAARQFWLDGPGNALYFSSTSHRMPAPASFNLMGGTFIQDSNGNGPMKAYVAEWSPAWDAGLRTGDVLISINGRKNPYPDLVEYVTTQRGLRPAWWSSAGTGWCASNGKFRPRPLPGIITPRPRPLRNRNSKTTSGSRKKKQTQPSADGQQPPATAGETPDEASPAADGKTDKASAA